MFLILSVWMAGCREGGNRLAQASSPYLREHADNPVDWHEWGDEALQKAKVENKPLLVSIGFASCHWCHVMERESFMDTAVAAIMNSRFVCIKIDREERPDLDQVFMNASQLLSGSTGWPLNAFALPDGKPFFAGTYYSKESWTSLLIQVADAYKNQHSKVTLQANAIANGIGALESDLFNNTIPEGTGQSQIYHQYYDSLFAKLDTVNGGLTGSPKFPNTSVTEFLFQYGHLSNQPEATRAAERTLNAMARGGIYDQLGGGFARYTVDTLWRIPHFEKMLADNAQLVSLYVHGFQLTGDPFFETVAKQTAAFMNKELHREGGGFYSSLNADTREGDGAFYTWSYNSFKEALGDKHELTARFFGVEPRAAGSDTKNILYTRFSVEEFARNHQLDPAAFNNTIDAHKKKLLEFRNKKERPGVDTKVLTAWNAVAITALADAYMAFGDSSYLQSALETAAFIENKLVDKNGLLLRNLAPAGKGIPAFMEDYALFGKACVRLYQVSFDQHWLLLARRLADTAIANYHDPASGLFYNTPDFATNIIVRKFAVNDYALPSANAVFASLLFELAAYFENPDYRVRSEAVVKRLTPLITGSPAYYSQLASQLGLQQMGTSELVFAGNKAAVYNRQIQQDYHPGTLYIGSAGEEYLPALQGRMVPGKTLICHCIDHVCKRPVESIEEVKIQLRGNSGNKPRTANEKSNNVSEVRK